MQPVMCSVRRGRAMGRPTWERTGTDICYYRNVFRNRAESSTTVGPPQHRRLLACRRFLFGDSV